MIDISIKKEAKADIKVVLLNANDNLPKDLNTKFSLQGFENNGNEGIFIQDSATYYLSLPSFDVDSIREAGAILVRRLRKYNIKSLSINGFNDSEKNYAFMLGILLGAYEFDTYKSKKSKTNLRNVYILESKKSFEDELNKAIIVSSSVNFTRNIINTPPEDCKPSDLVSIAKGLTKDSTLSCEIYDTKLLKSQKAGAMLAVARASVNEPFLIKLSYKVKNPKVRVVLVGKGLTYDTGGLSLKPSDYMTTMKADKSGGCAVLGIMEAIAAIKPDIEVVGIIGAVENAIGSNAYRPDDILYSREGVSIEVKNTDAEGRLVLADCLSFAQDLKPDYIIDLATLTGACVVALGEYTSGIMGYNENLKMEFEDIALKSGELMARLPFNKHLDKLLESKNADIANVSSTRYGGAITAGLFLGRFIREEYKQKWLHLDIAGPAFVEKEWDVNPYGGSGAGVRSVIEFILSKAK